MERTVDHLVFSIHRWVDLDLTPHYQEQIRQAITQLQNLDESYQYVQDPNDAVFLNHAQGTQLHDRERPSFGSNLDDSKSVTECISVLRSFGLGNAADRMEYLENQADEDPDSRDLEIGSVRAATRFLIDYQKFTEPEITASDNGLVYLSWMFGDNGIWDMQFLASGTVMFAAILYDGDSEKYNVSGTMTPGDAVDAARPVYEKLFCS